MSKRKDINVVFVCPVVKGLFRKDPALQEEPPRYSPFVQKDLDILKRHFHVKLVGFSGIRSYHRFLPRLLWEVMNNDVSFSWFGDIYAFLAVFLSSLLGKPGIVVIGGHDAWLAPKNALVRRYLRYTYNHAHRLLLVDGSLAADLKKNFGHTRKNALVLTTSYDPEYWSPDGSKDGSVITVSNVNEGRIPVKGLESFVEAARLLPDLDFLLVGALMDGAAQDLKASAPENVRFTGFLSLEEIRSLYRKASVFCQLSSFEGLPNALCEAMLCQCVPVGTRVYGIPTAMGDTGIYVPFGDPEATAEGIRRAVKLDGRKARERIIQRFPAESREKGLVSVIEELTGDLR